MRRLKKGEARLEHSKTVLCNVHPRGTCAGEYCTIHNRSNHRMRDFPQLWRGDRGIMERTCPDCGCGHPDPDSPWEKGSYEWVHGCCGACSSMGCQSTKH